MNRARESVSAWSHLANARHIDWVLESLKQDVEVWAEAWLEVSSNVWVKSWQEARDLVVRDPDRDRAWEAARDAAQKVVWPAARNESRWEAYDAAQSAILALIAWDDLDRYLNLNYEQLKVIAVLSEQPQALLLLPMVCARERIHA